MQGVDSKTRDEKVPLLQKLQSIREDDGGDHLEDDLGKRVWIESKKLWHIVGLAIFSRVSSYSMNVITQVFARHLSDLELATLSIANNVIVGFNFGLLLGMASALETLCGQAFGAKKYHMLGIYMQRSWIVLFCCSVLLLCSASADVLVCHSRFEMDGATGRRGRAVGYVGYLAHPSPLQFRISIPSAEVLTEPAQDWGDRLGFLGWSDCSYLRELDLRIWIQAGLGGSCYYP